MTASNFAVTHTMHIGSCEGCMEAARLAASNARVTGSTGATYSLTRSNPLTGERVKEHAASVVRVIKMLDES